MPDRWVSCCPGSPPEKDRAAFKQRQIGKAARLVARRRRQQARQQVGRICVISLLIGFRPGPHRAAAEQRRRLLVDKAVGHAFVITQPPPPCAAPLSAALQRRQHRLGTGAGAAGLALQLGQAGDAGDFLRPDRRCPAHRGASLGQRPDRPSRRKPSAVRWRAVRPRDVHADKADDARVQRIAARGVGNGTGGDDRMPRRRKDPGSSASPVPAPAG